MKISGIGVVSQKVVSSVLTREALKCIESGDMTWQEAGEMYKLEMVKKESKIGNMGDTFSACYKWIPDELKDKLSPKELANLTDQFYDCYSAGKASKKRD